jgi:hypothetical protein
MNGPRQAMRLKRPGMKASPRMFATVVDISAFSLQLFYNQNT